MNALEIKNLTKAFPGFRLEGLNLTLPSGCIMGLIGENGAGKSTTIKLILEMLRPDGGSVTVLGQERINKEDVGVVLDDMGLPESLNAEQIGKVMANIFRNWEGETYSAYLDKLTIPRKKAFKDFSKGMRMKLGIAIALSHRARLLILDEATSGLDPVVRDEVLELFSEFTRDENNSILISSHIVSDLEKLCDYVAFIHKGKLLLCEEKDLLMARYGIIRCETPQLDALDPAAVLGKKVSAYGAEAIVLRDAVPEGMHISPVGIEELFVFMVKEAK